jgi:hypothetical protein
MDLAGEFIGYLNVGNRRATGYRTKVPSRERRRANDYEVGITSTDDGVILVYDHTGNVIETHEHTGEFKEW